MALPDAVTLQTEHHTGSLATTGQVEWSGEGVSVRLEREGGALRVQVRSPQAAVKTVTLVWKHSAKPQALYLGDLWERSYGDLKWRTLDPDRLMPWYVMESDGGATHGFGVKTGCHAMCAWQVTDTTLKLIMDVRSGGAAVQLGPRTLNAAYVVARKGRPGESAFQATQAFCHSMCDAPRMPRRPMVGTLDWYYAYGKSTERLFIQEAGLFASLVEGCGVAAFALVDAGWAQGDRDVWHDDETASHPDFGSIQRVAEKVQAMGLVPGIWTRVLCAPPATPAELRSLRDPKLLDPSAPANLELIRARMRLFRSWGYGVIKHDFSTFDVLGRWGWQMPGLDLTQEGWTFRDNSRTTAEVILGLYQALREGCGDDACIIGCNTVSHLTAGWAEYCRVGDDSGGSLANAMRVGCNPFAFRLPQNEAFYVIDPDCIGNLKEIPWNYYRQFIRLASASGALLQLSTRLENVTPEQRTGLREGFERIGKHVPQAVEPLDWMEHPIPSKWRIGREVVEMDWNLTPAGS